MPIRECYEPLVDLRTFEKFSFSKKRQEPNPQFSLIRQSVASRLCQASVLLPDGMKFLIEEGYRSLSIQRTIYQHYFQALKEKFPEKDDQALRDDAALYVAHPDEFPPHATGSAIDLSLIDRFGKELDMGSTSDETPIQNHNAGFTHAENISSVAQANRQILIQAMSSQGFINYEFEWWHWSYGDRYWALRSQVPWAIYDVL